MEINKKKKIAPFRMVIFSCFLSFSLFFLNVPRANAFWGDAIPAAFIKQALEEMARSLEGALLASLKSVAITTMNTRVMSLIGGSSAGASQVISDWHAFLYEEPEVKVEAVMDDFFNSIFEGKNTYQYHSMLAAQDAGVNDYYEMLEEQMRGFDDEGDLRVNANELAGGDAFALLGEGDLRAFNAIFAKPTNNPWGLNLTAQMVEAQVRAQVQQEQIVKSISSGYRGIEKNGVTVLPGSTVGEIIANTQDIGNKVIAAASNPGELASGVIVSLTNQFVTNMIKNGIGQVTANINREIRSVDRKISGQIYELDKKLGPAGRFVKEVKKQTDIYVKPATNASATVPRYYDL